MSGNAFPIAALPLSSTRENAQRLGLRAVDKQVFSADSQGVLALRTPSEEVANALERHIARRIAATPRVGIRTCTSIVDSCWRDACAQLGVSRVPADPVDAARTLSEAAHHAVVVVLGDIRKGSWDDAVLQGLEHTPSHALYVLIRWGEPGQAFGTRDELFVGGNHDDLEAWWGGVVQEALSRQQSGNIADMDAWWSWSSRRMDDAPTPDLRTLSSEARALVVRLGLTGRAWPVRWKEMLGDGHVWNELMNLDIVLQLEGHLRLTSSASAVVQDATLEDLIRVADTLRARFADEPWALARAGVLYTRAGQQATGQTCLQESLRALDDTLARHEVWAGWRGALAQVEVERRRQGALHAAELALEHDDIDTALDLAHLAGGGDTNASFDAQYVLGRAQLARGDVVACRVSLERAFARSTSADQRAAALAKLAEASYMDGDLEEAARKAREAATLTDNVGIQLDASNTSGKLLLAAARWKDAEAHFAGNESTAAAAGLHLAELRARVNRAIALISKGQSESARGILECVLADGMKRRDLRATAFALSNLAVLAIDRHDYANALSLSERAIDARRRLGDKVGLAGVVANLAELRLRLGLLSEAEQTLAFGRSALRPGIPAARAAHFALVGARIRLARGDTLEASREIGAALENVDASSNGAMVGECYRLEARIALEDGDIPRAMRAIVEAEARADQPFARAEIALLRAKHAQAVGQDAVGQAEEALTEARQANDKDLLREANVLLAELYHIEGRSRAAKLHVDAAKQIRDRVLETLPATLRPRYLAKRELHRLGAIDDAVRLLASDPRGEGAPSRTKTYTGRPPQQGFVGSHASVVRLLAAVRKVATTSAPVLVIGESGTGKELIAEAIHAQSDRREGPLVKVNCAALVDTLLLSELFGHEKGAFTGASARRRGRFEMADGGTLFLDEIGDISPRTQVALLRVLQDNTFERVGGGAPLHADVRVVCATHRDLKQMVADGTFREDLYYRLSGVTLRVPSLRDRASDLPELSEHLLERVARERKEATKRLSHEALTALQLHRWPGNVRELDNALRAASLFSETDELSVETILEHVPVRALDVFSNSVPCMRSVDAVAPLPSVHAPLASENPDTERLAYDQIRSQGMSLFDLKRNIERECIRRALAETDGNITRAASLLGMKRPRLSQLVKQHCLLNGSWEDAS